MSESNEKMLYCSFCGKSQNEVRKLIAGPQVFICDECIELCNDIIREETQSQQPQRSGDDRLQGGVQVPDDVAVVDGGHGDDGPDIR